MDRRALLVGGLLSGASFSPAWAQDSAAKSLPLRFAAALTAADMKAFADLFAEDYVNHQISAAAPAPAGKSMKRATVEFFTNRVNALSGLTVSVETSLAEGDKCAASFVYEGVHDAVYYGYAPTGRKLRFTSCDIFRVAEGKIAEHWGMGDIAGVLAQLKG
jgi:predicted ester cyclase